MFDRSQDDANALNPTPGRFAPSVPFGEQPFRMNRALAVVPFAGFIGMILSTYKYRPLDEGLFYWLALIPFFVSTFWISHLQKKQKSGEDVRPYFPLTTWLAFVPVIVAGTVLLNGALDKRAPEQHPTYITRMTVSHGKGTSYYIEFSSWRPNRTTERVRVPYELYSQLQVGDHIVVELHPGAFAIPWLGRIHRPETISSN